MASERRTKLYFVRALCGNEWKTSECLADSMLDAVTWFLKTHGPASQSEVHRVLAKNAPKARPGRKKVKGGIARVRTQFDRHNARSTLLAVRLTIRRL